MKKRFKEKRKPVLCPNCNSQMVSMNKYVILKDGKESYAWHVCPRRKENNEKGCGHKSPVEIKKIEGYEEAGLSFASRLAGEVRSTEGLTMFIQKNFETFSTWLHKNREKLKDKKVEITIRETF